MSANWGAHVLDEVRGGLGLALLSLTPTLTPTLPLALTLALTLAPALPLPLPLPLPLALALALPLALPLTPNPSLLEEVRGGLGLALSQEPVARQGLVRGKGTA